MSEAFEIKRSGAKAQKNSGRGWRQKGDAILGPFLVDFKESLKSFSLTRSVWAKIGTDAMKHRLEPALAVALGEAGNRVRLWVVSDDMFQEMLEAWKEKNEI